MDFDTIVIGGGIIGLATAHALCSAGIRVAVLEKTRPGAGATGKSGGLIRIFDSNVQIASLALESVDEFQTSTSSTFGGSFVETGAIYIRKAITRIRTEQIVQTLTERGRYPFQVLDAGQCRDMFPYLAWNDTEPVLAVYEPKAGFADPLKIAINLTQRIEGANGCVLEGVEVLSLISDAARVHAVSTNLGTISANNFVFANGAWANRFDCPVLIRTREIEIHFLETSISHPIIVDETHGGLYMRPHINGSSLVGLPLLEWDGDPDAYRSVGNADRSRSVASIRMPTLANSRVSGGRRGFDGYTDDGQGYIGRSPSFRNVIWAAGWSGCGFKLAPAIASRVVRLVCAID